MERRIIHLLISLLVSVFSSKEVNTSVSGSNMSSVPWMLDHTISPTSKSDSLILCNTCSTTCTDLQSSSSKQSLSRSQPFLKSPKGLSLTVKYETEDEYRIVKEIVAMGRSSIKDRPPLTVSFLLCLCVQYSSASLHTSDLRRLLLLVASGVQNAMWVSLRVKMSFFFFLLISFLFT